MKFILWLALILPGFTLAEFREFELPKIPEGLKLDVVQVTATEVTIRGGYGKISTVRRTLFPSQKDQDWLDDFQKRFPEGEPGIDLESSKEPEFSDAPREFTNAEGRKITAKVVNVNGGTVALEIEGKTVDYPISKLSIEDQTYLKKWTQSPAARLKVDPIAKKLMVQVWEQDGAAPLKIKPGEHPTFTPPGGIPFSPNSRTVQQLKHFRVDFTNSTGATARPLQVHYIIFKRDSSGGIRRQRGQFLTTEIPTGKTQSFTTDNAALNYTKDTHITTNFITNSDGTVSRSSDKSYSRNRDSLGGIWVRVYSGKEMVKEVKKLTADVAKTNPAF